jgi:hypothetical protein
MADEVIGPNDIAFRLELTAAQMKVTHTALHALLDGYGHDERDVADIVREVLVKLPGDADMRAIDLSAELERRRRDAA